MKRTCFGSESPGRDPEYREKQAGPADPSPSSALENLTNRSVYIETYGCRYNFGDSVKLAEVLKSQGCTLAATPDDADAIVVNTCTVVGPTERRMLRRLAAFCNRDLYVMGCMPVIQRDAVLSVCTPVFLRSDEIHEKYRRIGTVPREGPGIVQLARGCSGTCSYCIARVARGPLVSAGKEEILSQVRAYASQGTAEIQLTAQDVSSWGRDSGESLPALLRDIGREPGHFRIRVGMMNPATVLPILDDLVKSYTSERIFRFFHLPVQSGSDAILQRMGRGYSVADFGTIVSAFRRRYPGITLATDMIVGFPGETEENFTASLDLLRRIRPDKVNVTRYSPRPFTPLAREKGLPDSVRKDRSRMMEACASRIYAANNARKLGTVVPFIVTEILRTGSVMARSPEYTGIVIRENLPVGTEGRALLTQDRKYFFMGERADG